MCDDPFAAVAGALIGAPVAWLAPAEIAAALDWSLDDTVSSLYQLASDRLIDHWNESVTLSPLAAERLGVRLVQTSHSEILRWSRDAVSIKSRRPGRRHVERMEAHDELLDKVPDPNAIDPAEAAERGERDGRVRRHGGGRKGAVRPILRGEVPGHVRLRPAAKIDELPRPNILLWGHGLWEWNEARSGRRPDVHCPRCRSTPRKRKGAAAVVQTACRACGLGRRKPRLGVCPGCQGRKLASSMYCLRCDRWGLDGYFRRLAIRARNEKRAAKRKAG